MNGYAVIKHLKKKKKKLCFYAKIYIYVNFEGGTKLLAIPFRSQILPKSRWLNYRSPLFFKENLEV